MKKTTAGAALAAAIGFSALTATPAMAVPYVNCSAAAADGVYNIQVGDSRYGEHLDDDLDGVGCENGDRDLTPVNTVDTVDTDTTNEDDVTTPVAPVAPVAEQPQIAEMPTGAVDAGVTVEESTNTGIVALAGGLALAGAAGATVVVRRRNAQA